MGSRPNSIVGIFGLQSRRTFGRARAVQKLRNAIVVPVICPTRQIVFVGKTSTPAAPFFSRGSLLCMGLFSIFWLGAKAALGKTLYSTGTPVDPRVVSLLPAACLA